MIDFELDSPVKVKVDLGHLLMQNVERLIMDMLDKMLEESTRNLAEGDHMVTGHLAKSGRTEYDKEAQEGICIYTAPYAAAHEYGSRAHVAPLGPSLNVEIPISKKTGKALAPKIKKRKVEKGYKPMGLLIKKKVKMVGTPDPKANPLDYWAWRKGKRKIISTKYGYHTALGFGTWIKTMQSGSDAHPYLRPAIDKVKAFFGYFAKKYGFETK